MDLSLDSMLKKCVNDASFYDVRVHASFVLMYELGLRHAELDLSRYVFIDNDTVLLNCAKKSEVRIITRDMLSANYFDVILKGVQSDLVLSRTSLSYYFNLIAFPYRVVSVNKNVCLHSFRYNYIKKLYAVYQDYSIVQSLIGHVDIKNTKVYIDKKLIIKSILF